MESNQEAEAWQLQCSEEDKGYYKHTQTWGARNLLDGNGSEERPEPVGIVGYSNSEGDSKNDLEDDSGGENLWFVGNHIKSLNLLWRSTGLLNCDSLKAIPLHQHPSTGASQNPGQNCDSESTTNLPRICLLNLRWSKYTHNYLGILLPWITSESPTEFLWELSQLTTINDEGCGDEYNSMCKQQCCCSICGMLEG